MENNLCESNKKKQNAQYIQSENKVIDENQVILKEKVEKKGEVAKTSTQQVVEIGEADSEDQNETAEIEELIEEIQELHSDTPTSLQDIQRLQEISRESSRQELSRPKYPTITWDMPRLWSPIGVLQLLLLICTLLSLTCLCTANYDGVSFLLLPSSNLMRIHVFIVVLAFLGTALLLLMDLAHLTNMVPCSWIKLNMVLNLIMAVMLLVVSSLVLHLLHSYHSLYPEEYNSTKVQFIMTSVFGYVGALLCLVIACSPLFCGGWYEPIQEDSNPDSIQME